LLTAAKTGKLGAKGLERRRLGTQRLQSPGLRKLQYSPRKKKKEIPTKLVPAQAKRIGEQ
jgi:hypothetical protein